MKKAVTKKGGKGRTTLYGGKQVDKDSLEIEVLGSIDELNSYLGLIKVQCQRSKLKNIIEALQKDLVLAAADIAAEAGSSKKIKKWFRKERIDWIEKTIKSFEPKIALKKNFYLPGQNIDSAYIDVARATARRAERKFVSLYKQKTSKNQNILQYLNRLSDLLFLLARFSEIG